MHEAADRKRCANKVAQPTSLGSRRGKKERKVEKRNSEHEIFRWKLLKFSFVQSTRFFLETSGKVDNGTAKYVSFCYISLISRTFRVMKPCAICSDNLSMKGDDSCEVRSAARKAIRKPFSREAYTPSAGKRKPSIVLLETIEVSERVFQIQKPGSMSYRLSSVGWKGPPRCAHVYGTTQTRQPISEGPFFVWVNRSENTGTLWCVHMNHLYRIVFVCRKVEFFSYDISNSITSRDEVFIFFSDSRYFTSACSVLKFSERFNETSRSLKVSIFK